MTETSICAGYGASERGVTLRHPVAQRTPRHPSSALGGRSAGRPGFLCRAPAAIPVMEPAYLGDHLTFAPET